MNERAPVGDQREARLSEVRTAAVQVPGARADAAQSLERVLERIASACRQAGRGPDEVALLAVSKTFGADEVDAMAACGQRAFGENYVQEAIGKMAVLSGAGRTPAAAPLQWHFVGPLQSNKTRPVAEHFDWVHSVDRERIAQRLSDQRPPSQSALQVCVQVNVSGEQQKSGCTPDDALALCQAVAGLPRLRLRGLMAVPEPSTDVALMRQRFAMLRELSVEIRRALPDECRATFDTLSMGMSADLEWAIAEGSTLVRVGTALFGTRPSKGEAPDGDRVARPQDAN